MQACRDVLSPGVAGFRSADTLFVQNQRLHFAKLGEWKLVTLQTRRRNNEVLPLNRSDSQKFVFYGCPTFPVFFDLIGLVAFEMATPTMGTRSASTRWCMKTTIKLQ